MTPGTGADAAPQASASLDCRGDVVDLTLDFLNIPSVSGNEAALADAIEACWRQQPHLEVLRDGDSLVARTHAGRAQRVIIAGHLDTVPISEHTHNVPGRRELRDGVDTLWGRGSVDMKGGSAMIAHLAATLTEARYDVTWVLYDNEEVTGIRNGLGRLMREHPDWVQGDVAIIGEPTAAGIEGGCNGTLRLGVTVHGLAAHSGRAWRGRNAAHELAQIISNVAQAPVRTVSVDGLDYRESMSVVGLEAGIATNTVPDRATAVINYRFAPDLTPQQALRRALDIIGGRECEPITGVAEQGFTWPEARYTIAPEIHGLQASSGPVEVWLDDLSPAARPGLDGELVTDLCERVRERGGSIAPKYGWTDVARFAALGIPALNYGPGDALLAHTDDEHCPVSQIEEVTQTLRAWLTGDPDGH